MSSVPLLANNALQFRMARAVQGEEQQTKVQEEPATLHLPAPPLATHATAAVGTLATTNSTLAIGQRGPRNKCTLVPNLRQKIQALEDRNKAVKQQDRQLEAHLAKARLVVALHHQDQLVVRHLFQYSSFVVFYYVTIDKEYAATHN